MAGMTACTGAVGGGTGSGSAGNGGPGTAGNPGPGSAGNTGPGTAGNPGPGSGGSTVTTGTAGTGGTGYVEMPCVPGIPRDHAAAAYAELAVRRHRARPPRCHHRRRRRRRAGSIDAALRRLRRPDGSRRVPHLQERRRGDRQGRHGQRDPEGQVHLVRSGRNRYRRDDLSDQHDQDVRTQGVPPPPGGCRGDALPGAWAEDDPGTDGRGVRGSDPSTHSSCRLRSSRCPRRTRRRPRARASSSPSTRSRSACPTCSGAPFRTTC